MKKNKRIEMLSRLGVWGPLGASVFAAAFALIMACNVLPLFTPVAACIAGELANGALEDPMLLVTGCAGATLAALIQAIQLEIANLSMPSSSPDSGAVFPTSDGGGPSSSAASLVVPPSPTPFSAAVAYKAHLQRILDKAQALQTGGGK